MPEKINPKHLKIWRLFLTVNAKTVTKIDKRLGTAGQIPLNWYDVLIELYEAPERRLRMSEIADRVLLTRSGLTRLVDRLEKEGYLIREVDPKDLRGFYATITDAGISVMRGAWKIYSASINEYFSQFISDEEAEVLEAVLSRMLDE